MNYESRSNKIFADALGVYSEGIKWIVLPAFMTGTMLLSAGCDSNQKSCFALPTNNPLPIIRIIDQPSSGLASETQYPIFVAVNNSATTTSSGSISIK
ncbi:MAG: hypothetical protein PHU42_00680 [Patescibacteria group bacterium]|nr:hypothetical protein [Patescibacteria group bacterium]